MMTKRFKVYVDYDTELRGGQQTVFYAGNTPGPLFTALIGCKIVDIEPWDENERILVFTLERPESS